MPAFEYDTLARVRDVVVWPPAGVYGDGEVTVGTPYDMKVRWVNKAVRVLQPNGNTIQFDASMVIGNQDVVVGSIVWIGPDPRGGTLADLAGTDPVPTTSLPLYQVKGFNSTEDLKGRHTRRDAVLMRYGDTLPQSGA